MPRYSNKSAAEILSPRNVSFIDENDNDKHLVLLERKIALATEVLPTNKG
ncbi:MAG: hypothetical protein ACJ71R_03865 [Nitrososphaeraceae archaeon]